MSEYNKPSCTTEVGNTGVNDCSFDPKHIIGAMLIPKSKVFTENELAAIKTTLQTGTLAAPELRMYPIFKFVALTDGSEEETISTKGYGNKSVNREGKYDWTFEVMGGGVCLQKKLRMFNGNKKYKVLFFTADKYLVGTKDTTGQLMGVAYDDIYAKPFKLSDGTNDTMYMIRFLLSKPEELNDTPFAMKLDFDPEENIKGLIDLELYEVSVTTGEATIQVRTACDKLNLYDLYTTELTNVANWTVSKAGAEVTIDVIVPNATTKDFTLHVSNTGDHVFTLAAPATLAADGMGGAPDNGYEAGTVTVTLPTS